MIRNMKTYSQYKQDEHIYNTYFTGVKNGIFVDVGAEDGERFSNTKLFEDMGWLGLCVEPRPIAFNHLKTVRTCLVENCAISDEEGEFDFLCLNEYGKGLSGLVDKYPDQHKARIKRDATFTRDDVIKVKCFTLDNILQKHNIGDIDYLSIDVEGAELNVLKSINWDRQKIKIITAENNYGETDVRDFLAEKGYSYGGKAGIDDVFINN